MTKRIYVGNLPFSANQEEIEELFGQHGEVVECVLPQDRETGRPRGFGFIEMENEDALKAISSIDGTDFGGRTLRVSEANPRDDSRGGGGGGGDRGGGGGNRGGYGGSGGGGGGYGGGGGGYDR